MSSIKSLQRKDKDAAEERVATKGSPIFGTADYIRKAGHEERYDKLLSQNKLSFIQTGSYKRATLISLRTQ